MVSAPVIYIYIYIYRRDQNSEAPSGHWTYNERTQYVLCTNQTFYVRTLKVQCPLGVIIHHGLYENCLSHESINFCLGSINYHFNNVTTVIALVEDILYQLICTLEHGY